MICSRILTPATSNGMVTGCTLDADAPTAGCSVVSARAEIAPAAATVEIADAGGLLAEKFTATAGVIATCPVELTAPVDKDGLVTPSPFTKILTAEP